MSNKEINYYEEKIKEIQTFINEDDIELALKALQEELGMPYIPKKYEEQLQNQYLELMQKMQKEIGHDKNIDASTIIEFLNDANPMKQAMALDAINKVNLRQISNELKEWIEKTDDQFSKAAHVVIIEALINQKVDVTIKLGKYNINCLKSESLFDNEEVLKMFDEISKRTIKEPQLEKIAQQVIQSYLIVSYPEIPSEETIIEKVVNIARYMVGEEIVLSEQEENIKDKIVEYF